MVKDIGLRGASRRDFMRGVFTASAALGLGPTRALDMLEKMGGSALAQSAIQQGLRAIHINMGVGGISRMTQVIPPPLLIEAPNANYAIDDVTYFQKVDTGANGNKLYTRVVGGKPMFVGRPWTAFVSGVVQAHSVSPAFAQNVTNIVNGPHLFSSGAVLQQAQASLVPSVASFGNQQPNTAPTPAGAPNPALVANANAFTGLFSSAASQLMTRLQPTANQSLFGQYYTAFLGLAQWGDKPTYARAKSDAKIALSLVVKNLASQLQPQAGQLATWTNNLAIAQTDAKVSGLVNNLIVSLNAMKLGLTSTVIIRAHEDDPHGYFANSLQVQRDNGDSLALALDSFMNEAAKVNEPGSSRKLADRMVLTASGDTVKNFFVRGGWPDGNICNVLWVNGAGYTKPGWVGGMTPNARINWNPVTGAQDAAANTGVCTTAAVAATLYAISGGNKDAIRQFTPQAFDGVVNANLQGV